MSQPEQTDLIDGLSGILKLIKNRQDNYFKLTDFIKKNIDGMKNQTQQVSIVNIFLRGIQDRQVQLAEREEVLINQFKDLTIKSEKFIFRLSARIFEIFQGSLLKIKGTLFYYDKIQSDFKHFQSKIGENISQQIIQLGTFVVNTLDYSKLKYHNELNKISKFLCRLQDGQRIYLKQFYQGYNNNQQYEKDSINEQISPQRQFKRKKLSKQQKKSREKYKEKKQSSNNKSSKSPQRLEKKPSKTNIVNKMMKLYSVIDPSKVQFIQDLIYEDAEQHKIKTINSLIQKNKDISEQISQYFKKIDPIKQKIIKLKRNTRSDTSAVEASGSSLQRQRNKASFRKSEANMKNTFIISKQKRVKKNNVDTLKKLQGYDQNHIELTQLISNSAFGELSSEGQYLSDTNGITVKANKKLKVPLKRPGSKTLVKPKVFPNLSISEKPDILYPFQEEQQKIRKKERLKTNHHNNNINNCNTNTNNHTIFNSSSNKNTRNYIVKSPTINEQQNANQKTLFLNMARTSKKNPKLFQTKNTGRRKPSAKKVVSVPLSNRSSFHIEQKSPNFLNKELIIDNFNMIGQQIEKAHFLENKQSTTKRQFNLRLKKQNKRGILLNQKIFIQQTNQQINNYNFPQ